MLTFKEFIRFEFTYFNVINGADAVRNGSVKPSSTTAGKKGGTIRIRHEIDNQFNKPKYLNVKSEKDFEKLAKGLHSVIRRGNRIDGFDDNNIRHEYYLPTGKGKNKYK